jgi:hypothetical protein
MIALSFSYRYDDLYASSVDAAGRAELCVTICGTSLAGDGWDGFEKIVSVISIKNAEMIWVMYDMHRAYSAHCTSV